MKALNAFAQILRPHQVITGDRLESYANTTSFDPTHPGCVLLPESTIEVSAIAKVGHQFKIPLYPISRGKNWGYGDACAPTDGQVIIDMKNMNRIVEVNSSLAYAVIEPGVTQGQLWNYLQQHHPDLWMDATGAGPEASLVGNTADRGFGHTKYGDHFLNTCSMEVVLADGRILNTGYGHFANARAKYTYRYGVGPILDGLFSQSNMGIITRLAIWLMPKPETFCAFFFLAPRDHDLREVIDLLSPLKRKGLLPSAVHIANDLRTLSGKISYPWERANGQTPLPDSLRHQLRKEFGIGAWNVCGSITGSTEMVDAIKKKMKRALRPYKLIYLDDKKLTMVEKVAHLMTFFPIKKFKSFKEKIKIIRPVYEMLKGFPVSEPLRGAAWRVRDQSKIEASLHQGKVLNPVEAGAGLIWVSPILPMVGADAIELTQLLRPIYAKYGFDFLVTFTLLTDRSLCCVTNISFDRSISFEVQQAKKCYQELVEAMMAAGFLPYRSGPAGFSKLGNGSSVFWDVVKELKRAIDPQGIISPGRYAPLYVTKKPD